MERIERIIFQAIVTGDNLTIEDVTRMANHVRFRKKLFMVSDTCRVSVKRLSDSASVFTVVNYYYVDSLCLKERIRHYLGKLRTTALLNMGISEVVVVIINDTGF
ncbi:MAG TPA: hypothetical protein K8W04_12355 [Bacteroides reticulotermitis]|nr:hypothetical protein [Bacteroides reticulotermitis]